MNARLSEVCDVESILKQLERKAKDFVEIKTWVRSAKGDVSRKWVSVETVTALLMKLYSRLMSGRELVYNKDSVDAPIGHSLHSFSGVNWEHIQQVFAEDFASDKSFILVSRKQLTERLKKLEKFTTQIASGKREIIEEILRDGF